MLCFALLFTAGTAAAAPGFELTPVLEPEPHLVATAHGVGQVAAGPVTLGWEDDAAVSTATMPFRQGAETLAVALVMSGQELFIGNAAIEPDPNAQATGVLYAFQAALDELRLATTAPPGSTFEVVTYATGTHVQVPPVPIGEAAGSQLGSEKDYRGKIGNDLVAGIEVAMHDLQASPAPIKLLFVFGDGNDTNNEEAKRALADLGAQASAHRIAIGGAIWKSVVSDSAHNVVRVLAPDAKLVSDGAEAAHELGAAIDRATDRMAVTFDARAPWDGKPHAFMLRVGGVNIGPVIAQLPDLRRPWWRPAWTQLVLGLGVVALIAALLQRRR